MGKREYKDVPRVYVDMDGVLADFDKACTQAKKKPSELKLIRGVYRDLEVIPGAINAIEKIVEMGYEVWAMTKPPSKNPSAASEKIEWMYELFPVFKDRIIITPDKGAVGEKRDFIIDDHPEWANVEKFRGTIIKFENNWDYIVDFLAKEKAVYDYVFHGKLTKLGAQTFLQRAGIMDENGEIKNLISD